MHRCAGYSAVLLFLRGDRFPGYFWPSEFELSVGELNVYRGVYAHAMREAMGSGGDGKFTAKSAIYTAFTLLFKE